MASAVRAGALLALAAVLSSLAVPAHSSEPASGRTGPALFSAGIVGDQSWMNAVQALPPDTRGDYVDESSVVRLADGRLVFGPVRRDWARLSILDFSTADRLATDGARWLEAGLVPGADEDERAMARRALLDLRLLARPNGALVAGWYPSWRYVWPRDASWAAAAFAATGHTAEARSVLGFLRRTQRRNGTWAARYHMSGTGPVRDGRHWQLDADGWVPWAVWFWYLHEAPGPEARLRLAGYWPMVAGAADAAARSLRRSGLPVPAPDYWEARHDQVTLGTAAPLLAGLRAAADIAGVLGQQEAAQRWSAAAKRLDGGLRSRFRPYRYQRTPGPLGGADAAVTFLAPPFAPYDPEVAAAVRTAEGELTLRDGGILPGEAWRGDRTTAWTPETAFFALAAASSGDRLTARRWLGWLADHRTTLGALPEKVDEAGRPASVAPLAWTCAIVLLALTAEERPLPIPPVGPADYPSVATVRVRTSLPVTGGGGSRPPAAHG